MPSAASHLTLLQQVRMALRSLPSTSEACQWGLRPSHFRDAMRPASSDLPFRLLSEVVSILLRGEVPDAIQPFVESGTCRVRLILKLESG